VERRLAVRGAHGLVAVSLEDGAHHLADGRAVIDDEDAGGHATWGASIDQGALFLEEVRRLERGAPHHEHGEPLFMRGVVLRTFVSAVTLSFAHTNQMMSFLARA